MTEPSPKQKPSQINERLLKLLEDATSMEVRMSLNESAYDLNFISEKLALVSTYQERLSDIQMKLTRISLDVIQVARAHKALLALKEKEFKASDEYAETPVHQKGFWLANQLTAHQQSSEEWQSLVFVVSEVKEAVNERAGTMKRLDSDIRLHARLYEQRVAAGATSPATYTGKQVGEIDI
jgi:hypothetical protein